jgi:hypothetical protein
MLFFVFSLKGKRKNRNKGEITNIWWGENYRQVIYTQEFVTGVARHGR